MHKIIEARPLKDYQLWIKFSDGVEGVADLTDLAGKGVFSAWKKPGFFNSVYLDQEAHTVAWEGGLDLCPDVLYSKIAGVDFTSFLQKKLEKVDS
jgi:hypothetical protein